MDTQSSCNYELNEIKNAERELEAAVAKVNSQIAAYKDKGKSLARNMNSFYLQHQSVLRLKI